MRHMADKETEEFLGNAHTSREIWAVNLFANYDEDPEKETDEVSAEDALQDSILAVDTYRGFKVQISFGGPSEWLDCRVDEDGDLVSVEFIAAWWSSPRESDVREGDALWRLAEYHNPFVGL
jgi:hypothetical protein